MRQSPVNKILILIKKEGPQLAATIGEALGTTGEAARQQLAKLAAKGLVEARSEGDGGRGRPRQFWHLTAEGHRVFPDGHAELAAGLIDTLRQTLGPEALEAVIAARENQTAAYYAAALAGEGDLPDRVARLAALRTQEGYMADWWRDENGSCILVENHCPICAAATACSNFCVSELAVFRRVLDADVERLEHILHGARRCAYRIRPLHP